MKISIETAIRNAEATLRMEGMQPSPVVLRECKRVLDGEISHEQYMSIIREKFMEPDSASVQP